MIPRFIFHIYISRDSFAMADVIVKIVMTTFPNIRLPNGNHPSLFQMRKFVPECPVADMMAWYRTEAGNYHSQFVAEFSA